MSTDSALRAPELVPPIHSERLELVPLLPGVIEALLAGDTRQASHIAGYEIPAQWPAEDRGFLEMRLGQLRQDPDWQQWLMRAILLADTRTMIGNVGFHDPPREGVKLEIGYGVFPQFRGQGFATEAALALMQWARDAHGITRFVASVSPTNEPSLAIVGKLGFVKTGVQWDEEDGEEIVFELELASGT